MFESLSGRLSAVFDKLTRQGALSESDVSTAMREVRVALLKHEKGADWPAELEPRPRHPWLEAQVVDLADSTNQRL